MNNGLSYTIEEFDSAKTRVLKYIIYKKRTEYEIRNKFSRTYNEELLEDVIDYLKEYGYVNDGEYITIAVNDFIALRNLSIKELKYKLISKGLKKELIDDYFDEHKEELNKYEINSAKNIMQKKSSQMDQIEINQFLLKKGYKKESITQGEEC